MKHRWTTEEMHAASADSWRLFDESANEVDQLAELTPRQLFEAGFASGYVKGGSAVSDMLKKGLGL